MFLSHGANSNYGIKADRSKRAGDPSYECADALEVAVSSGNAEAIEVLVKAGAEAAYGVYCTMRPALLFLGTTPYDRHASLPEASDDSRIPAMAALLKHGADVNRKEGTPHNTAKYAVVHAVIAGAVQRFRWPLDYGADPRLKGSFDSAIDYAAIRDTDEMKALLPCPARFN